MVYDGLPMTCENAAVAASASGTARTTARSRFRWARARIVIFVAAIVVIAMVRPVSRHARAASLLMELSSPSRTVAVTDERLTFDREGESVPARLYVPRGVSNPPGVVLVHGVHRAGIEEPRLVRFARALSRTGVVVMTPLVTELRDYKVAPQSIDTVGSAVLALGARIGSEKIGLMGMSFGGGISLLAAADPRFADHVSFVVAVGAHDDLGRVSRFFVNDEVQTPDGETKKLHAHAYGVTVLVYSHVEDFFPPDDVPKAREALRLWLWEQRSDARRAAESLTAPSKAKLASLFDAGGSSMKGELLAEIDRHRSDMTLVSPHGRLGAIRSNVYLLHGESDTVIPPTETLWLARDVPPEHLRDVLVSPAIEHVELKAPSPADKWALVHFMGRVIGEAESSR